MPAQRRPSTGRSSETRRHNLSFHKSSRHEVLFVRRRRMDAAATIRGCTKAAVARLTRPPHIPSTLPPDWSQLLTAMTSGDKIKRPTASDVAEALREISTSPADAPTAILEADRPTNSTRAMTVTSLEAPRKPWMPGPRRWLIASGFVVILFVIGIWLVTSQIQGAADSPSDLAADCLAWTRSPYAGSQ